MAYLAHSGMLHAASSDRAEPHSASRRGFWRLLIDAIRLAHQRDAEREIERYLARRGKLTDTIEREIADRLIGNGSNFR